MKLNDTDVSFQLDSGAICNLLPLKGSSRVTGDPENLKKNNARLTIYNGTVMYPVEKCNLTSKKGDASQNVGFQVIDKTLRLLLGEETCKGLNFMKILVNDTLNAALSDKTTKFLLTKEVIMKEHKNVFEG